MLKSGYKMIKSPNKPIKKKCDPLEIIQETTSFGEIDELEQSFPNLNIKEQITGTPDYIAPEIINNSNDERAISFGIDWWAVGCIIYEFLCGIAPFNDTSVTKIFQRINTLDIEWPEIGLGQNNISFLAKDLIEKLLVIDYKKRLGYNGIEEIKKHKFFEGIDWTNIYNKEPPIKPEININEYCGNEELRDIVSNDDLECKVKGGIEDNSK